MALIAVLSLLPAEDMVRTGVGGHIEHAAAYAGTALLAGLGFSRHGLSRIAAMLVVHAGVLEPLQLFCAVDTRMDMEEGELVVDFEGREVAYGFGELDELALAYATTVHKSQGSEHPAVVIPLTTQHFPMLQRNLVYTGVTRGKRLVVLVGQRRALAIAVRGQQTRRRWSKLKEWLAPGPAAPDARGR